MSWTETAYAKINLALHVRARRDDGYHELETLFAFVDCGDTLTATTAKQDSVRTIGAFASGIADPFGNLVAKALTKLPRGDGLSVTLDKNLPVAAGLGGGSADAGAILRIIRQRNGLPDDWQERAARLGADVPACIASEMAIGRGIGEQLEAVENDLSCTPILLVNDGTAMPTGPVFKAWDRQDRGPLPNGLASQIAREGRNDLERPAMLIAPSIATVLDVLRQGPGWLVRMSGSGASCFALYNSEQDREADAKRIAQEQPHWWQMSGALR